MKQVFIKYNPYRVITEITIDGKGLRKYSPLNVGNKRFQEWIDQLPELLKKECNSKNFNIIFHGTELDYEDLKEVTEAANKNGFSFVIEHKPAKEVKDKEKAIRNIFNRIKEGPFNEFRESDVIDAFEQAMSKKVEVNVFAMMSAGKSTLINALLCKELMPWKTSACTAKITKITDNDKKVFTAKTYDKKGGSLKKYNNITYDLMNKLNEDNDISLIQIEGDIPFVTTEEASLVLVDTPGPNFYVDRGHERMTKRVINDSSKPLVIYVLDATQLRTTGDAELFKQIVEAMSSGGKQSRDRFIFVANKIDAFRGNDNIDEELNKTRKYLQSMGVKEANIFPASARTALEIRTTLREYSSNISNISDTELLDAIEDAKDDMKRINREKFHLEKYAPLPESIKQNIKVRLDNSIKADNREEQALIHTGIVSIEDAIKLYVNKYAATAKIKNITDTFTNKLVSKELLVNTESEIFSNSEDHKKLEEKINELNSKIENGHEAKRIIDEFNKIDFENQIRIAANNRIKYFTKTVRTLIEEYIGGNKRLTPEDAKIQSKEIIKIANNQSNLARVDLEGLVKNEVVKTANSYLKTYRDHLKELSNLLSTDTIKIDFFEIMKTEIPSIDSMILKATKTEDVIGDIWVPDPHFYEKIPLFGGILGFLFGEGGKFEQGKVDEIQYIETNELINSIVTEVERGLRVNQNSAIHFAIEQTNRVKKDFSDKVMEMDKVLAVITNDWQKTLSSKEAIDEKLAETQRKLLWLETINKDINDILDI